MISKPVAKFIKSLQLKKYRKQEQMFIVEGEKSVLELLNSSFIIDKLLATTSFIEKNADKIRGINVVPCTAKELEAVGTLKTNEAALAVVKMLPTQEATLPANEFCLVLDDINDPGNLGTILRIADWYGINQIFASENTADCYNPKVISASKGSFTRVKITYTNLEDLLKDKDLPIYGAYLEGENVHKIKFATSGVLVLGNEANGISPAIAQYISHKITIPRFGKAESLNVAMATAIICDNIKRS